MKKLLLSLAIIFVVCCIVLLCSKDIIARAILTKGIKDAAKAYVSMQKAHIGLLKPCLSITGLKISNSKMPSGIEFADVPEVYIEFDWFSLFSSPIHFKKMRIHIQEIRITQGLNGKKNLGSLLRALPSMPLPQIPLAPREERLRLKPAFPRVSIGSLTLQVARIVYKDFNQQPDPRIIEFNFNFNQTFENVVDISRIGEQIMTKILGKAGLAQLFTGNLKPAQ